ncbi:NAD(P)-dependent alcohol dehydrogenase [Kineosporia sp. NBRC 101731]|uniref:NAD(P)-dependent alcohol dehydrogenase n=1 Tax=Kineosporia sp. NBRC 101731 TaxID=3032199 RepID=UPI0024A5F497|nr:NAD(P)-dependent alcohol dehydrogenase [Kineosporia sp. NBRC 101731]GLY29734.1 NADPH:quinone reductase [Kineosporia sp. NBRC 101731]
MDTMRAAQFDAYGDAEVLHVSTVERPRADAGKVLVRVEAASVNPHDLFTRSGALRLISGRTFPLGTGLDFAGTVVGSNPESGFETGAQVWGSVPAMKSHATGTMAEYVVVTPDRIGPRPPELTPAEAAAFVVAGTTAIRALQDVAELQPGEKVLIRGAAGAVGLAAVRIAVALGASVTTLSSHRDLDLLRELGAEHVLDYRTTEPTQIERQDVIFDTAGTDLLAFRRRLNRRGRMVTIAFTSAAAFAAIGTSTVFGSRRIRAFSSDAQRDLLDRLAKFVVTGVLRPDVAATYDIDDIVSAHLAQEGRGARGKHVVVLPGANEN